MSDKFIKYRIHRVEAVALKSEVAAIDVWVNKERVENRSIYATSSHSSVDYQYGVLVLKSGYVIKTHSAVECLADQFMKQPMRSPRKSKEETL
jgi:hypothetical protein